MCRSSLVLLFVAWAWGCAWGVELINPSFEDSEDPNNPIQHLAAGWGTWGGWMNRETGWSPIRSGDCVIGYHHFRITDANSSGLYQDVPDIPEGSECTFRIFACEDSGTHVGKIEVRLEPLDGGAAIASKTYTSGDIKVDQWTELSVSGTLPLKGVRVVVEVCPKASAPRSGALKFDDAELSVR